MQIAVLQEQKKAFSEKDEDEARESETIMFTAQHNSETNELNIDEALTKETQVTRIWICSLLRDMVL